jgi:hypothetical protein
VSLVKIHVSHCLTGSGIPSEFGGSISNSLGVTAGR